MLTQKDMMVFEAVARAHPQLREYLSRELDQKIQVLVQVTDVEQLKRTQGYAQCLQNLIATLDKAIAPKR